MVIIDFLLQAFLIVVPVWLLFSFALFVIHEEQSKVAATPANMADSTTELDLPEVATAIVETDPIAEPNDKTETKTTSSKPQSIAKLQREPSPTVVITQFSGSLEAAKHEDHCSLPTIARSNLTIWQRRGESVVPIASLTCSVPQAIQRLRWRGTEVVRFADLQQIAAIV